MAADPALAFSQNLVKSYIQFKLAERQYDLFERREKRYGAQLQANQRFAQEGRRIQQEQFATTQKRLTATAESLVTQRGLPRRGTTEDFISQGYGPETAQRLQDQEVGLISRPSTPYQRVTAGKMMMENATTTDMFNAGKQIMEEAMTDLKGQVAFPSRAGEVEPQGGEAKGEPAFPSSTKPAVSPELEIIPGEEPITMAEWGPIAEKAQRNGIEVIEIYRAAAKFKGLNLSKEEMLTALDKLAEGATAEQIIEFLKSGVPGSQ